MQQHIRDGFTLPGEAGYEALVLRLAGQWGADVIRDSDGTQLSASLLNAGKAIYSTVCPIRDHNPWISENPDAQQQTFLMSRPVLAQTDTVEIPLLDGYETAQFSIDAEHLCYWQVFDRTAQQELTQWSYCPERQSVLVKNVTAWHRITVNFLAYRIWEEISMYNHITNSWTKEHLRQIDPWHPKAQRYLLNWMDTWCQAHPATDVVRFTSLFFNFVWIWGADPAQRNLFTDWASYDFTVSAQALAQFEELYGWRPSSENFINMGYRHATHCPPDKTKLLWMEFVHAFVASFGRQLVSIVHSYGKKAYVFYDDSWVGVEPYGPHFQEIGFDGLIKCAFSGFEARLCAENTAVKTHELRLHPYLFPTGLQNDPVFLPGGHPERDAMGYWVHIRRAMLRAKIDRIGLGGYLHLVEGFPEFCNTIAKIADEFRAIRELHRHGRPYTLPCKVGILTVWGKLRTWSCSGHYHEHPDLDLINLLESLSGLPFPVEFLDFSDLLSGKLQDVDILINAGTAGSAWSGGSAWANPEVVAAVTQWANQGGVFLGVNAPSATEGFDTYFRMAPVLGLDLDTGKRICHGRRSYAVERSSLVYPGVRLEENRDLYLLDGDVQILAGSQNGISLTAHPFGKGYGVYLSEFRYSPENTRLLYNLLCAYGGQTPACSTADCNTECAWFPDSGRLVLLNNLEKARQCEVTLNGHTQIVDMAPLECKILDV